MSVTVIVATYGDRDRWDRIAMRAILSAEEQTRPPERIIRHHGTSLHGARNAAAMEAQTEWLCFLDADDALDERYLAEMLRGTGDLRYPRVINLVNGVREGGYIEHKPAPTGRLVDANFMVIGTLVRRRQFLRVGGFDDLPMLEDWDLWLRCTRDGAAPQLVPDAYYLVGTDGDRRNADLELAHQIHLELHRRYPSD